jgi:addiction module HigA family antidote
MTKKLPPMHPGEVLREEFLVPLKLSAGALARKMDVPRTRIERIAERAAVEQGARHYTAALAQPAERL